MLNIYDKALGSNSVETLVVLVLIAFFLFIGLGALEVTRSKILAFVSTRIDKVFAPKCYDIALVNAVATSSSGNEGLILQDLARVRHFLTGSGILAFLDAPWIPGYIVILFWFDAYLGWLGVLAGIALFLLSVMNQRFTAPAVQQANVLMIESEKESQRVMKNVEVAGALGIFPRLKSRWVDQKSEMLDAQEASNIGAAFFTGVIKAARVAIQSGALALGAYLALIQEITPGMIIAASVVTGRALQPIEQIVNTWPTFLDVLTRYKRVEEQIDNLPVRNADSLELPQITGLIRARQATVVPPGARLPVLEGLTFTFTPGTVTVIMGPSGSGKSSLIKAMLGVWPTSLGDIRLDGAEATSYEREKLGPQIGYLPQGIELFDGTVAQNIGRFSAIDSDAVITAAKLAGVHAFILSLPNGYDTEIGSNEGVLSPGQAQRIALARAIYGQPKLVILDEPNSNLDLEGEAALNQTISVLQSLGTTVVVVSHRTGVAAIASSVVLLSEGKIVDSGAYEEVMNRQRALLPPSREPAAKQQQVKQQVDRRLPGAINCSSAPRKCGIPFRAAAEFLVQTRELILNLRMISTPAVLATGF